MHVTDWAAAQKEDPELNAVLQWLGSRKKAESEDTSWGVYKERGGFGWCGGIARTSLPF